MSRTLIIAEHDGQNLNPSTAKCANCATAIGLEYDIVVMGSSVGDIAGQAAAIDGTGTVFTIDSEHLASPLAANHASEVAAMAGNYSHILGPSTTYGRDLMPRIAALLGVNQVSDISSVEGTLGEVVGKLYVERHFKPEAKERMQQLVDNLRASLSLG